MKLILGNNSILNVKYLVDNNGSPYYQRGIPKDIRGRFGLSLIKLRLEPKPGNSLAKQVQTLSASHAALFESLRRNPDLIATKEKLLSLLYAQYRTSIDRVEDGLVDSASDEEEDLIDTETFLLSHPAKEAAGRATAQDRMAYQVLQPTLPMVLSEALKIYFNNHPKGRSEAYRAAVGIHWNKLIEILGDVPLISLSRGQARKYRDVRLSQFKDRDCKIPIKSTTVLREINQIKAVISRVFREEEIDMRNPFESLDIPGLGSDSKKRESLSAKELNLLINSAKGHLDEIRRIIVIQAYTGARISEIAGLRVSDFIDKKIPYISICSYGERTLKTKQSERDVPLVGLALLAAQIQVTMLEKGETVLFPRYCNKEGNVKSEAVSAVVNQYIRSVGIDKTNHCLRHTMRDLLRDANITSDIAHELGGWGSQVIGDRYGKGFGMQAKQEAMIKGFSKIKLNSIPMNVIGEAKRPVKGRSYKADGSWMSSRVVTLDFGKGPQDIEVIVEHLPALKNEAHARRAKIIRSS